MRGIVGFAAACFVLVILSSEEGSFWWLLCGNAEKADRKMTGFLKQIFTWWNGSTIGTRFFTWRRGKRVGEDQFGNIYYEGGRHKDGYPRRWVIYKGYSEASTIPPGWHGWIHHRCDVPPTEENYQSYEWEKPHIANMTGTSGAYRPKGSIAYDGRKSRVCKDYDAWLPER